MSSKKFFAFRSAMATAGAALAIASGFVQAQEITVGVVLAISGAGSAVGVPTRNATTLWPVELGGRKVKMIVLDDRSDPSVATSTARRLAMDDKVDVIVGGSLTPGSLAISAVANEAGVPHLTLSPTVLTEKNATWSFNLPHSTSLMASAVFEHMSRNDLTSVGYIGFSDVWGDQWLGELKKYADKSRVKVTAEERFGRADTSVAGQVLRLISTRPDAILVGGTSSAAGLVHKTLIENGYKGRIYHTHGAVTKDFIRVAGRLGEGAIAPAGPSAVAEELPSGHPSKGPANDFVKRYESEFGEATRTPFAAHLYDAALVLEKAVPAALEKGQPGTQEFRNALKEAMEHIRDLPASQGVISYRPDDHYGMDERARVLATVRQGKWAYMQ